MSATSTATRHLSLPSAASWLPRWASANREPLGVAVSSRIAVYLLIAAAGWASRPKTTPGFSYDAFFAPLGRWDAQWYGWIASYGYDPIIGHGETVAFFPLFPALWHALMALPGPSTLAVSVFNSICFCVAVTVIHRITAARYGRQVATCTVLLICFFPLSFVYTMPYAESIFLLLTAFGIEAVEHGKVGRAMVLIALSVAARPTDIFLAPVLFFAVAARTGYRSWRPFAAAAVPVAAYAAVSAYLGSVTGSLTATSDAEQRGWGRQLTFPITFAYDQLVTQVGTGHHLRVLVDVMFALFWLTMIVLLWRMRAGLGYVSYGALAVIVPVADGSLLSMGRLGMVAFPLFWPAAVTMARSPRWTLAGAMCCAILLPMFVFFSLATNSYVP